MHLDHQSRYDSICVVFDEINDLYASSLPSLIGGGIVEGILLTVSNRSFVLLFDRFAMIDPPKRFRQHHRWIGHAALVLGIIQCIFTAFDLRLNAVFCNSIFR